MAKRKLTGRKALMLQAMQDQLGIVTAACKQAGIDRTTHYLWMNKDDNYVAWIEESRLQLKDFGENVLLKLMKAGNPAAIIFFNKTKNKDRGYVERQEIITDLIMRKTATPEEVSIFEEFYDENGQARNKEDSNKG